MSETKFTKGPWGRSHYANGQPRIYRIGRDYKESDIAGTYGDNDIANAHLIASAPEMYAMLEDLAMGQEYYSKDAITKLLTKARGETK